MSPSNINGGARIIIHYIILYLAWKIYILNKSEYTLSGHIIYTRLSNSEKSLFGLLNNYITFCKSVLLLRAMF